MLRTLQRNGHSLSLDVKVFFLFWQKDFLVCLYPYKIHPLRENWERRSPLGQFILYIIAWRGETLFSQNMNINECWMTKENNFPSSIGVKLSKSYRQRLCSVLFETPSFKNGWYEVKREYDEWCKRLWDVSLLLPKTNYSPEKTIN